MNKTAEELLDQVDYISQDGDTVSIDEGLIHETMEAYANQKVIEELENQMDLAEVGNSYVRLRERIIKLKQD